MNKSEQIKVTKINSIEGDAMITMIRGKKKFIYDYTISLDWTLLIGERMYYLSLCQCLYLCMSSD